VYAIRATILVAKKSALEKRKFIPIHQIAEELGLSFHFLTKILQILTEAGIMKSFRGPNGGVGLARPAHSISLLDIIEAVDGLKVFEECVLGLPSCDEQHPCPVHDGWKRNRDRIRRLFGKSSVPSLARKIEQQSLRG
jgi:Rrf2 family protein